MPHVEETLSDAPEGSFSIVALPDTQQYALNAPDVFYAETQWILDNRESQSFAFVSHLGDIVDENTAPEWEVAARAMHRLDGLIPYGLAIGNGDMRCKSGDVSTFLRYFPSTSFLQYPWYGGCYPPRDNASSYQLFDAAGLEFLALHLEINAPDAPVEWANQVLASHPRRRAIVTTHMFLGPVEKPSANEGYFTDPKGVMQWTRCHGEQGNSPRQLWDKCFRKHPNVFLILCGDQSRTQTMNLRLTGDHGNPVRACLSDYRGGNIRIYRFLPSANRIRVMTFSVLNRTLTRSTDIVPDEAGHLFEFDYPMRP